MRKQFAWGAMWVCGFTVYTVRCRQCWTWDARFTSRTLAGQRATEHRKECQP